MKKMKRLLPIIIIFALLSPVSITVFAQEEKPPTLVPMEVKSAKGAQFIKDWNYFTVENNNCTAKQILNELQADGGGALMAESLWLKEGENWIKYEFSEATKSGSLVEPQQTLAFFSNTDFYFDLKPDDCSQENPQREQQILGLRAVQNKELAAKQSLLEKIATLPFEFWQSFWDLVTGEKKEGKTGDVSLPSDARTELEELIVTGKTNLADLGITGTVTTGLLVIEGLEEEGASLETLSKPLKLQKNALGNLEIMGGKVIIDTQGNLKVEGEITVKKINVEKTAGQATIPADRARIVVESEALTENSLIFVTPERPVAVGAEKVSENRFEITVKEVLTEDLPVNWWVVN